MSLRSLVVLILELTEGFFELLLVRVFVVKQAFAFLGHLRDPLVELNRDLIADGADHVSEIVIFIR